MPRSERVRFVVVVLTLPVAAFVAMDQRGRPSDLVALFTGLNERDAHDVRIELEVRRVPFELRDGGQTIMVPAARSAELKIELVRFTRPSAQEDAALRPGLEQESPALRGAVPAAFRRDAPSVSGHNERRF